MCSGIYGNNAEDRAREAELNRYLNNQQREDDRDEQITELAKDKFMALPDFYTCRDGTKKWTNIDDASDSITQLEWIAIARALRDGDELLAGINLKVALMRVLKQEAEYEIDEREDC